MLLDIIERVVIGNHKSAGPVPLLVLLSVLDRYCLKLMLLMLVFVLLFFLLLNLVLWLVVVVLI